MELTQLALGPCIIALPASRLDHRIHQIIPRKQDMSLLFTVITKIYYIT